MGAHAFAFLSALGALAAYVYRQASLETLGAEDFRNCSGEFNNSASQFDLFQKYGYKVAQLPLQISVDHAWGRPGESLATTAHPLLLATAYRDMRPPPPDSVSKTKQESVVIVLHGATMGSFAYLQFQDSFANKGYRTIVYDQYSRGFSDRLRQDGNVHRQESTNGELDPSENLSYMDLHANQLLGLLLELKLIVRKRNPTRSSEGFEKSDGGPKIFVYGVSLGAALAAVFTARYPSLVDAVGFQVPVIDGISEIVGRKISALLRAPLLGELLARFVLARMAIARGEVNILGDGVSSPSSLSSVPPSTGVADISRSSQGGEASRRATPSAAEVFAYFKTQFSVYGTERDGLAMLRDSSVLYQSRRADHQSISKQARIPVLFQYAKDDDEIPADSVQNLISEVYLREGRTRGGSSDAGHVQIEEYEGGHFFRCRAV